MAKSTAHVDKLGNYDDFKAPWESEAGSDTEIDKPKLKRLIFNLKLDHAKSRDTNEDSKAEVAEVNSELETAKQQAADAAGGDAQKTIDKLTRERDEAKAKVSEYEERDAESELRSEVLGDFAEKNPKAAKYVTGKTKEELEASLEAVKADFGLDGESDEEEEEEEETPEVHTRPRSTNLRTPADPLKGKPGDDAIDFDKVANDYLQGGSVFH